MQYKVLNINKILTIIANYILTILAEIKQKL